MTYKLDNTHSALNVGWDARYGRSTGGTTEDSMPPLTEMYYKNWAYLDSEGVVDRNGSSIRFPIIIGEFGSPFNTTSLAPYDSNLQVTHKWFHLAQCYKIHQDRESAFCQGPHPHRLQISDMLHTLP